MAEDIKGLIDKIQKEGMQAAQQKAKNIEGQAEQKAKEIITSAEKQAQKLIEESQTRIATMEQRAQATLKQAGRDLLLSLRAELNALLDKLVAQETASALGPDELSKIITELIKGATKDLSREIVITLKPGELNQLAKTFLHKLSQEVKKGITLRPSGEITGGLTISYDGDKSHYDFTDQAMAAYLTAFLKPKLAEVLGQAASGSKKK
ncbi:MAG: hypothetical protein JW714_05085 [Candidatus Omnitrophica bacterium]|nr:hypothetical protein [Candidatus Omnitrophota bacterium]